MIKSILRRTVVLVLTTLCCVIPNTAVADEEEPAPLKIVRRETPISVKESEVPAKTQLQGIKNFSRYKYVGSAVYGPVRAAVISSLIGGSPSRNSTTGISSSSTAGKPSTPLTTYVRGRLKAGVGDLEFLKRLADGTVDFYLREGWQSAGGERVGRISILAGTKEDAAKLANLVLQILDEDVFQPAQQAAVNKWQKKSDEIAVARKQLGELEEVHEKLEQTRRESERFTEEELRQLRHKSRLLKIDEAGLLARIRAYQRVLKKDLRDSSREELENMMIAAEVELAGVAAAFEQSMEFRKRAEAFLKLDDELGKARLARMNMANNTLPALEGRLKSYRRDYDNTRILEFVDNVVTIQPIEWTE